MTFPDSADFSDIKPGEEFRVVPVVRRNKPIRTASGAALRNIGAALVVLALLLLFDRTNARNATVVIDIQGRQRTFQGQVVSGMTVLDALNVSAKAGGLGLDVSSGSGGKPGNVTIEGQNGWSGKVASVFINGGLLDISDIQTRLLKPHDRVVVTVPAPK